MGGWSKLFLKQIDTFYVGFSETLSYIELRSVISLGKYVDYFLIIIYLFIYLLFQLGGPFNGKHWSPMGPSLYRDTIKNLKAKKDTQTFNNVI